MGGRGGGQQGWRQQTLFALSRLNSATIALMVYRLARLGRSTNVAARTDESCWNKVPDSAAGFIGGCSMESAASSGATIAVARRAARIGVRAPTASESSPWPHSHASYRCQRSATPQTPNH